MLIPGDRDETMHLIKKGIPAGSLIVNSQPKWCKKSVSANGCQKRKKAFVFTTGTSIDNHDSKKEKGNRRSKVKLQATKVPKVQPYVKSTFPLTSSLVHSHDTRDSGTGWRLRRGWVSQLCLNGDSRSGAGDGTIPRPNPCLQRVRRSAPLSFSSVSPSSSSVHRHKKPIKLFLLFYFTFLTTIIVCIL